MKYNRLCYVGTVYALFIYMSIHKRQELENTFFLFGEGIPIKVRKKFSNSITLYTKNKFSIIFYFFYIKCLCWRLFNNNKIEEIWGQDHLPYSAFFLKCKNFILIEDGVGTYKEYESINFNLLKELIRYVFTGVTLSQINDRRYITNVIFTGLSKLPAYLAEKAIVINLQNYFNNSDKEYLCELLSVDSSIISSISTKDILILTQTLSEEGYISEQEKIDLYANIMTKYPNEKILLKPHPIETTDYSRYFPDITILPRHIPIQILFFMGFEPIKVATITSTGALGIKGVQLDWYGSKISSKLTGKITDIHTSTVSL